MPWPLGLSAANHGVM